jgi:hypothetical protein
MRVLKDRPKQLQWHRINVNLLEILGEYKAKAILLRRCGRGPQARVADCCCDPSGPQALSIGKHEAIPGFAFNHCGCCDLRREDHAED